MDKHEIVLNALYDRLQDDLDDAWKMYNSARELKICNDIEMSRFMLTEARARLDHSDMIKEKIDYYKSKNNIVDNSGYKTFYCFVLDKIDDLKIKVTNFKI